LANEQGGTPQETTKETGIPWARKGAFLGLRSESKVLNMCENCVSAVLNCGTNFPP
jgi:hypothetical protein